MKFKIIMLLSFVSLVSFSNDVKTDKALENSITKDYDREKYKPWNISQLPIYFENWEHKEA